MPIFKKITENNEFYLYMNGKLIYKRWLLTGQSKVFDIMAYDKFTLKSITEDSIKRTKNSYDTYLGEFTNEILTECIKCGSSSIFKDNIIICDKCGYNKKIEEQNYIITLSDGEVLDYSLNVNSNQKNNLKLWFSVDCCGENLWAYNRKHLNFLKEHVEATLRERNNLPFSNKSLGSRLPKWMTSKKNRDSVLKAIEKLNSK